MSDDLRSTLLFLETALAERKPSGIEGGLARLLADDFVEFGRSGGIWTRDSMLEALLAEPPAPPVRMERFEVVELAADVVLVTYHSAMANRSSVWLRRDGRWQLRFHQGTEVRSRQEMRSPR